MYSIFQVTVYICRYSIGMTTSLRVSINFLYCIPFAAIALFVAFRITATTPKQGEVDNRLGEHGFPCAILQYNKLDEKWNINYLRISSRYYQVPAVLKLIAWYAAMARDRNVLILLDGRPSLSSRSGVAARPLRSYLFHPPFALLYRNLAERLIDNSRVLKTGFYRD